jgi:hypothetical protein
MDTIEQDLRDEYEHLVRKRASEETVREATLALARPDAGKGRPHCARDCIARDRRSQGEARG